MANMTVAGVVVKDPKFFENDRGGSCKLEVREFTRKIPNSNKEPQSQFFGVWCNRNVNSIMDTIKNGMPVLVTGRFKLSKREYEGKNYYNADIQANYVGKLVMDPRSDSSESQAPPEQKTTSDSDVPF